jgi:hypothetical protein
MGKAAALKTKLRLLQNGPFFECFSLCLSRACVGKIFVFIYKWQNWAMWTTDNSGIWDNYYACNNVTPPDEGWIGHWPPSGQKTPFFAPFIYKMHYFTKTGSGQTYGKLKKEWHFYINSPRL